MWPGSRKKPSRRDPDPDPEEWTGEIDARVESVTPLLQRLVLEGGRYNFLVLAVPGSGAYVQFTCGRGDRELHCEAVSSAVVDDVYTAAGAERLRILGWQPPRPPDVANHWMRHPIAGDDDARILAAHALTTLREVYGLPDTALLEATVHLG